MTTFADIRWLALPMLLAASCGGGGGGTGADMASPSCNGGVVPFALKAGTYQTTDVTNLTEMCGLGLTANDLMSARKVAVDGAGKVTLSSEDGSAVLGVGAVQCNMGTLTYGPTELLSGACQFSTTRSAQVTVTADNQLTVNYSETRNNFRSAQGQVCMQAQPCMIQFTLTLKM